MIVVNKQGDNWNGAGRVWCLDEENVVPTRNDGFVCLEMIDNEDYNMMMRIVECLFQIGLFFSN